MKREITRAVASLWFAACTFGLGYVGSYYLLTVKADWLPAWVTLGGTIVVAAWVGIHHFASTYAEDRRPSTIAPRVARR